jgi:hypothetical protein
VRPFRAMSMSAAGRSICIAIDEAINWIAGPDFQEESERPLFINMYDNPLPVTFIIQSLGNAAAQPYNSHRAELPLIFGSKEG